MFLYRAGDRVPGTVLRGFLSPIDQVSSAFRSHPQVIPLFLSYLCIRSLRKLRAFAVGVFFDSSYPSCGRCYRPQTTTPYPPLPGALEFRWGLPCLLSTLLRILQEASRVRYVGLKRNAIGGAFLAAPSALCGFPVVHRVGQVYLCDRVQYLYDLLYRSYFQLV